MVTRVLVVDDHPLMRSAVRSYLGFASDMECVGEAENGAVALQKVEELLPDLVAMDIHMPVQGGIEATREIARRFPHVSVLAVTAFSAEHHVVQALKAGARGYVVKDAYAADVLEAVRAAAAGETVLPPAMTQDLVDDVSRDVEDIRQDLLDRVPVPEVPESQLRVLKLLGRGKSNADIAGELFLAEDTVKKYFARLNERFGTRDRVQLLIRAVELGFIEPGRS